MVHPRWVRCESYPNGEEGPSMSLDRRYVDILTMGRSGVDIFPLQVAEHLEDVKTVGKFLSGVGYGVYDRVCGSGFRAG